MQLPAQMRRATVSSPVASMMRTLKPEEEIKEVVE